MATQTEPLAAWRLPYTVADEATIETLDERTRTAVERYIHSKTRGVVDGMLDRIADDVKAAVLDAVSDALRAVRR